MNVLFNKSVLLLVLSGLPCISAIAQKAKSNPKVFIARIAMMDDTRAKGVLYLVSDTTIVLIPLGKKGLDGKDSVVIRTRDVKHITTKRKASGAVAGLVVGALSYKETCDYGPCLDDEGASAAGGAILGGMTGMIVGGIIGSISRTFKINGKPLTQEQRAKLEKFALH
jgi:hypothetical protein